MKQKRLRSKEYLKYIRSLRCAWCGTDQGVQAHHVETGGMGLKCDDYKSMPLCVGCHRDFHDGNIDDDGFCHRSALNHLCDWLRNQGEDVL